MPESSLPALQPLPVTDILLFFQMVGPEAPEDSMLFHTFVLFMATLHNFSCPDVSRVPRNKGIAPRALDPPFSHGLSS